MKREDRQEDLEEAQALFDRVLVLLRDLRARQRLGLGVSGKCRLDPVGERGVGNAAVARHDHRVDEPWLADKRLSRGEVEQREGRPAG